MTHSKVPFVSLPFFGFVIPASLPGGKRINSHFPFFGLDLVVRVWSFQTPSFFWSQTLSSIVTCKKVFALFPKLLTLPLPPTPHRATTRCPTKWRSPTRRSCSGGGEMTGGRRDSVESFGFSVLGQSSVAPSVVAYILLSPGTCCYL